MPSRCFEKSLLRLPSYGGFVPTAVDRKMSTRTVYALIILSLAAFVSTMPDDKDADNGFSFGLPFIQFKDGGIRFNFAGYHAEAGLGGLLGNARTGGGLHASAGTPWGAHAAAGLGGALNGDDANAGGGLYARAGLGEGRPEAAAGLGGTLDGSGRSNAPVRGGLFAGATAGNFKGDSASGNVGANVIDNAAADASGTTENKKSSGNSRSSVQIISRSEKNAQKSKEERHDVQGAVLEPTAAVGLFGGLYVEPFIADVSGIKSTETIKTSNGEVKTIEQTPHVPPSPALIDETLYAKNTNAVVQSDSSKSAVKPAYSRWNLRKRIWAIGPRKHAIYASSSNANAQADSSLSLPGNPPRIVTRQSGDYTDNSPSEAQATNSAQNENRNDRIFDDIFNIPISTLKAVNQLFQNAPA